MIIADLRTSVYSSEMIISDTRTAVSLMEALISVVEKMVSGAETIISATDTVFLEAETAFAVSEKTVGGAPAVVFHQQPTIRSCEKMAHTPRLVQFPAISRYPLGQKADSFWSAPISKKRSNSQHFCRWFVRLGANCGKSAAVCCMAG